MKRILSVMLSIMLCVSCITVGTTAVFADNTNTYTPVVKLTPDMYTPKTVYVDDDFNNRDTTGTDLGAIASGKTAYDHQVIMKANNKIATNYGLGSDTTDTYAQVVTGSSSLALFDCNNKNVDKINVSFRFRFPTYKKGMYFVVKAKPKEGTENKTLLQFQIPSTSQTKCSVYYIKKGNTGTTWAANITTQGSDTWNRVNFQLERVADAENPGSYNVYIRKLVFIDSAGNITNVNTANAFKDPVDADWWSGSVTNSTIASAAYVALRITHNKTTDLCIDDVMVYEPETLMMSNAYYDSTSGKVKAVFTRGLKSDTLSGITLKKGDADITSSVALDTTDTSNRTVIITPSEAIDTANNLYTVTAEGVQDLFGDTVPTRSISFGTDTGGAEEPEVPVEPEAPETPISVVQLASKMYTPKTVYVDDDFNNRDTTGTDLGAVASGKTAYDHQVIMKANNKTVTNYGLGSDTTDTYAQVADTSRSMALLDYNNIDADKIDVSFRFRFPTYENGMRFYLEATKAGATSDSKFLMFQVNSNQNQCLVNYYPNGGSSTSTISTFTTQGSDTWNRVNFQLERVTDAESSSGYKVYIRKFSFTTSDGIVTDVNTSGLTPVDVDWWSGSIKSGTLDNTNKVALRIANNASTKDMCIDDVMVYEPEDLKMSDAYKSTSMKVKARFTRGLKSDTLGGIFLRKGNTLVDTTSVALDTSDTSGRTVIITPSAAIDTVNNLYTVIATGVKDVDGNNVPTGAITFGDGNGVIESLYVNGTEVSADNIGATAGQTISAYLSCVNTLGADAVITPIIGYYEGDTLMSVGFGEPATVSNGARGSYLATLTMPATVGTNGEFRVFAIKIDSMTPVLLDPVIKAN